MDRTECLIFLKGQERGENIQSIEKDRNTGSYSVIFKGAEDKKYTYKASSVKIYKPTLLDPAFYSVSFKGKILKGIKTIYRYEEAERWYIDFGNRKYLWKDAALKVSHSGLESREATAVLKYLKEVSFVNPIEDEEGERILSRRYSQIGFVDEASALSMYLSGKAGLSSFPAPGLIIYPFGTNKSQKKAVINALSNKLSVIQGPPGTGKTQTILTIIANLLLQNKTVEVVSNNNSAVDNVKEKFERYGLSFLLAPLGSAENKEKFISSQSGLYPDISSWRMADEEMSSCESRINELSAALDVYYEAQEEIQRKTTELNKLETELRHFSDLFSVLPDRKGWERFSSSRLIEFLRQYSDYFQNHDRFSFLWRFRTVIFQSSLSWEEAKGSGSDILQKLQWRYYNQRKRELQQEIALLSGRIEQFDMRSKERLLCDLSLKFLKGVLYTRVEGKTERPVFCRDDLWKKSASVIAEYPVITSTAFSSSVSLEGLMYDYVIVDEASQCDIASGALSLLYSRNAVIVGDSRQLKNVVTEEERIYTENVFKKYVIPEAYRYASFSFLSSVTQLFPKAPSVLLLEHYRCQPRIIGFCNEKFYENQLVVMTADKKSDNELALFLTPPGFHSREHSNLRQAEVIAQEVLPSLGDTENIGIITPYQNNVRLIKSVIKRDDIKVDTIHSFQGREMDTIIFSTSDDLVNEFSDSPTLINVALSRARERFILVASSDAQRAKSNIGDLISYISYNSFKPIASGVVSVFDLLYEQSSAVRIEYLAKHKRISRYESENLMYSAIVDILNSKQFTDYDFKVACHYPLRYLFRDTKLLSEEERLYLSRAGTHVDFLIYRTIGKRPVLAIEVDGFHYHKKGSRQYERDLKKDSIFSKYDLSFLRFQTNGSGEREKIIDFLSHYIAN